jgi:hypothetical protein
MDADSILKAIDAQGNKVRELKVIFIEPMDV